MRSGLKLLFENATTVVDKIMDPAFQDMTRKFKLPKSVEIIHGKVNLNISYGIIDGRIIAVRFLDYLKQSKLDCTVARPIVLHGSKLDYGAIDKMSDITATRVAIFYDGITNLNSYGRGELKIIGENDKPYFNMKRAIPRTFSVQVDTCGLEDQIDLLNGFAAQLKKQI